MSPDTIKSKSGTFAWMALAAFVAAYDTWALSRDGITLSSAFKQSVEHPSWRWVVGTIWLLTTLHLFGVAPRRYDPYHGYGVLLGKVHVRAGRRLLNTDT